MRTILHLTLALLAMAAPAETGRQHRMKVRSALQQLAEVTGAQAGDFFGSAVAVSGNVVVVGAPLATVACNDQASCGAAYVFQTSGNWSDLTQVATLTESNGMPSGNFGASVAISGNTIIVSGTDATIGEGAAYVFVKPANGWTDMTQTAELTISGQGPFGNGFSVAIQNDTVVLGAEEASSNQGSAYVYVEPVGGWTNATQTAQLVNTDGKPNFQFGASVSISNRNVVVGASSATVGGVSGQGLAYLFVEPLGGWAGTITQKSEFEPSDGSKNAAFGARVSVSGDTVAIGSTGANVNLKREQGAVYVFTKPANGWTKNMTETAKLTAKDGGGGNRLGISVALSGNILVAGEAGKNSFQGSVYVFVAPASGWRNASQVAEIISSDGGPSSHFGGSSAIGSQVIVIGAYGQPDGSDQGATYVFGEAQ